MYIASTLKTGFDGLIGWRQNDDSAGWQISDATLVTSSSGLWYNGIHPLLTLDNIISVAPQFDIIHSGDDAARDTAFSAWLRRKTEDSIIKAIDNWLSTKFKVRTARNLLNTAKLFHATGNVTDFEANTGKPVGITLNLYNSKSLTIKIKQIGLQIETNQSVTIRLFEQGKKAHVQEEVVSYTANGGLQWFAVDWDLNQASYWLVYDQGVLSGRHINGIRNYTVCDPGYPSVVQTDFFDAAPFEVAIDDISELWDLSKNTYTSDTNYGLNLDIDVKCDYTAFVVDQKDLFKRYISLQVGIDFLQEILSNPNSKVNRNEANIDKRKAEFDLYGDTQGKNSFSLISQLELALGQVEFDLAGIDSVCLPCRNRSIDYTTIGPMSTTFPLRF